MLYPSTNIEITPAYRLPLATLGLLYVACGAFAGWRRWNEPVAAFFLYAAASGLHWGGSIGVDDGADASILAFYVASSAFADGALLHFALVVFRPGPIARAAKSAGYAPAVAAVCVVPIAAMLPYQALLTFLSLALALGSLVSLFAGTVLVVRFVREPVARVFLWPMVLIGLPGAGVALVGGTGALPGSSDAWHLLLAVLPVCTAYVLRVGGPSEPSGGSQVAVRS